MRAGRGRKELENWDTRLKYVEQRLFRLDEEYKAVPTFAELEKRLEGHRCVEKLWNGGGRGTAPGEGSRSGKKIMMSAKR